MIARTDCVMMREGLAFGYAQLEQNPATTQHHLDGYIHAVQVLADTLHAQRPEFDRAKFISRAVGSSNHLRCVTTEQTVNQE